MWNDLTMQQRADVISMAVKAGIRDIDSIKSFYEESIGSGRFRSEEALPMVTVEPKKFDKGSYLDIAKSHIRKNEGWSPKPVADGPKKSGWRSVGYGFNDSGFRAKYPQGISKAYENGITKAQAEQELDYIIRNMDSHLKKVYGSKWNSFNDNQKAAILDTYYQRPASVVGKKSAFYNAVMRGDKNAGSYLGVSGFTQRNNDRRNLFGNTKIEEPIVLPVSQNTNIKLDSQSQKETPLIPEFQAIPQFSDFALPLLNRGRLDKEEIQQPIVPAYQHPYSIYDLYDTYWKNLGISVGSRRFAEGGNLFGGEDKPAQQMALKSKQAPWYSELDEAVLGEVMQQVRNIVHPGNIEYASYKTDVRGKKGGTAQRTYLLPRFEQEDIFLRDGYIKGKEGDYGLVKKAVNNRNLPVWQTAPDAASRETLVPIGNAYGMDSYGYINRDKDLVHAESRPAAFYVDGSTGKLYIKGWDLNDYGGTGGGNSSKYNIFEKTGAKILDFIGNPVVVTTGFQEVTNPWGGASKHLNRGATIQDLFDYDDEGYPIESNLGKLLDTAMGKKGLHRENIDGKWVYALPEITVTGKKKKALGGPLVDMANAHYYNSGGEAVIVK